MAGGAHEPGRRPHRRVGGDVVEPLERPHGTLRAIVQPAGSGEVEARFRATFWKIFSAGYTVQLNAVEHAGHWTLSGTQDVGRWLCWDFGQFQYLGAATAHSFHCNYTSPTDHGVFELKRPD
jgi:hypothetical protein